MKKITYFNTKKSQRTILLLLLVSSISFLSIISNHFNNLGLYNSEPTIEDDNIYNKIPQSGDISNDEWWNVDFEFRTLLNITNPGSDVFIDNIGVSINFNYSKLVIEGKMNSSLKDLRIIENGILRNYYIQKDFPVVGNATVWFKCNVTAGVSDYDTYMYYGNNTVDFADDYLLDQNPMGVMWFGFDEGTGNSVTDSNDGGVYTVINGANWASGKVGSNCLDFQNDWINLGDLSKLKITGNQTIAMWMAPDSLYARQNPYGKAYGGEGTITLEQTSGSLSYYYGQGGGNSQPYQGFGSGSGTVSTGVWQHVAIVRDLTNNQLYWYKDGNIRNTAAALFSPASISTLSATIGDNYVDYFDGRLDDIRIFDRALSYDEIQWLYNFNYSIDASLLQENEQGAEVNIVVRDVDGRAVPNAIVFLHNETSILFNKTTNQVGVASFSIIPYDFYNITVNFTLSLGAEAIVYNSSIIGETIEFRGLHETKNLYVNLTTIDFEIDDYDEDPMNLGHVNISLTPSGPVIETLTLDSDGKATFQWLNGSTYYYKVFYDNIDYFQQYTLLNSSSIERKELFNETTILANQTASAIGNNFLINETVYANDSSPSSIGKTRIVKADIKLRDMTDYMTSLSVYYVDSQGGSTMGNLIYIKEYSGDIEEDDIQLFVSDNYSAYGLRIVVQGYDISHISNGTIAVNITQTTHQYIKTNMSKISIKVIDESAGHPPISGVFVHIYNGTTTYPNSVVNLTTSSYGYAYDDTYNMSFWYLHDIYNFTFEFFSEIKTFDVNYTDPLQWQASDVDLYNYTLYQASTIIFELKIDTSKYMTNFSYYEGDLDAMWGENISYQVNFTYTTDGSTWLELTDPEEVLCEVYLWGANPQLLYSKDMVNQGSGNFAKTINSSIFSAGTSSASYIVKISGHKKGYSDPFPVYFPITITALPTALTFHNYSNPTQIISQVSEHFNEALNITLKYRNTDNDNPLYGADITYVWDYGSGTVLQDPRTGYEQYYTIEINSSLASNTGLYKFKFTATLQNYTKITDYILDVYILERPTTLNGSIQVFYSSESTYALNAKNFTFDYSDTLTSSIIQNADEKNYFWQKLYANGSIIPGEADSGNLIESLSHLYILDLNTETMTCGEYFVYITIEKKNFELRTSIISLSIQERPTSLNATEPIPASIIIEQGDTSNFTFSYIDTLTGNPITDLDKKTYNYTGDATGQGIMDYDPLNEVYYMLGFNTAILTNGTYIITVHFEKENYTSQIDDFILIIDYIITDYSSFLHIMSVNPSNFTTEIYWRDNVSILFNYTTQYQSNPEVLDDPDTLYLQFRDESFNLISTPINLLNFNISLYGEYYYTFNSSQFSFIGGQSYYMNIYAGKTGYTPPISLSILFKVLAVTTDFTICNSSGIEFPSYTISEYWNTTLGITLYYTESVSSAPITDAYVTFSWFYGSGQVLPDVTKGAGYYSFLFNTGNASEVGAYTITFLAIKQNYSNGIPVSSFIINVINRPTMLDTSATVLYVSQKIYVQEAYNFTFEYIDFLTSNLIENADEMSFVLQKLDADGVPIPGISFSGTLFETINHRYVLDLNTETLTDGEYSIVVTLNKDNYEFRVSIVSLTINKRVFTEVLSISTLTEIASGGALQFQVTLTDPNNNSVPVIGATLYFTIQGTRHDLTDNGDGTYSLNIASIADPFFLPEPYRGILKIEKANFTTIEISITVNVKMTEIFPGFPMFYFLMIVGAIIAVVGSLVAYRTIQQARIPTFVKKVRQMSKSIKGKKSISDSLLYPSKEEYIVKLLGERWEVLGLSLDEILGLDAIKKKKLPETIDLKGGNV